MRLAELLHDLHQAVIEGPDVDVTAVCYDSRLAVPGCLFAAVAGFHVDGHAFVGDALARGASAVLCERERLPEAGRADARERGASLVFVPDSRQALASVAATFHGYPSRHLRVIGVTGTDGKTTTSYLTCAVLDEAGLLSGMVGTVDFKVGTRIWANKSRQTTPEAPDIQELLADMVRAGVKAAVVESTSHGLALHRLSGIEYDVAVLTNVTSDHLDFHGTRERYLRDKRRLFEALAASLDKGVPKAAVVNADDPASEDFARAAGHPVIRYGIEGRCDLRATDVESAGVSSRFHIEFQRERAAVRLPLPGRFNVYNALAAAGAGLSQGLSLETCARALSQAGQVPGRMERIEAGQPFAVIVDYAHTPDSLAKALSVLRPLTPGKLTVVFGAAGERDRARRDGMGRVAAGQADFAIITNEDPRFEDPEAILADIAGGLNQAGAREGHAFVRVLDRRQAIAAALGRARVGDTVLLTGKGHEQCMIVGDEKVPWDDREVAREELGHLGWSPTSG